MHSISDRGWALFVESLFFIGSLFFFTGSVISFIRTFKGH